MCFYGINKFINTMMLTENFKGEWKKIVIQVIKLIPGTNELLEIDEF